MSEQENLIQITLFELLDDNEKEIFLDACEKVTYSATQVIFNEDDSGDTLYIVNAGRVQISKFIEGYQEEPLATIYEGEVFGEMAFVDGTPRSSTAMALEDCELYFIKKETFDKILAENPAMAEKILFQLCRTLSRRLRSTNEKVKDNILINIEISRAKELSLNKLISLDSDIEMEFKNGEKLRGQLLLIQTTELGYQVTIKDKAGGIYIIPYDSINYLSLNETDFRQITGE